MSRSVILWIVAVIITLGSAFWQRVSGPTYPVRFGEEVGSAAVSGKLLRTHSINGDLPVTIEVSGGDVTGEVVWRHFPTDEPWQRVTLASADGELTATLPAQPMAGKVEYRVELSNGDAKLTLPKDKMAVARFKGDVPAAILIVHIFCMFFGMLWSLRAGLEAISGGDGLSRQSLVTLLLLGLGGLCLGPIVQKYAFDAYWTGWPLGEDLTDNKLALAVLLWAVAVGRIRLGKVAGAGRRLAVIAMLVTAVIFAIPHSMHGSTLDYETMEHIQR